MSRIIVGFVFLFGAISLVIGSVVTYMWSSGRAANMNGDTIVLKIAGPAFLVGAVLSIAGGVFLKHLLLKPIVFDQGVGRYWRGPNPQNERSVALKSIFALQIIGKWVTQTGPDTGGYASYELNAVTSDAERHNVVDHGDIGGLQDDAELLAKFLDVPVWDTTLD